MQITQILGGPHFKYLNYTRAIEPQSSKKWKGRTRALGALRQFVLNASRVQYHLQGTSAFSAFLVFWVVYEFPIFSKGKNDAKHLTSDSEAHLTLHSRGKTHIRPDASYLERRTCEGDEKPFTQVKLLHFENADGNGDGDEAVEIKISKDCVFTHLPTEEACSFACEGERSWVMIWQRSGELTGAELKLVVTDLVKAPEIVSKRCLG